MSYPHARSLLPAHSANLLDEGQWRSMWVRFGAILYSGMTAVLWGGQTEPSSWPCRSAGGGVSALQPQRPWSVPWLCPGPSLCHAAAFLLGSKEEGRMWSHLQGDQRPSGELQMRKWAWGGEHQPRPLPHFSFNASHLRRCPDHFSQI